MKMNLSKVIAFALAFLMPVATLAASKVMFDNQSGKPALVKLIGPTTTSISVENGKKESVAVAPGSYFIKVRYGTAGAFSYSKGEEFDVNATPSITTDITITLHKVVAGNYGSKPISEAEFGPSGATDIQGINGTKDQRTTPKTVKDGVLTQDSRFRTVGLIVHEAFLHDQSKYSFGDIAEICRKRLREAGLTVTIIDSKTGSDVKKPDDLKDQFDAVLTIDYEQSLGAAYSLFGAGGRSAHKPIIHRAKLTCKHSSGVVISDTCIGRSSSSVSGRGFEVSNKIISTALESFEAALEKSTVWDKISKLSSESNISNREK